MHTIVCITKKSNYNFNIRSPFNQVCILQIKTQMHSTSRLVVCQVYFLIFLKYIKLNSKLGIRLIYYFKLLKTLW